MKAKKGEFKGRYYCSNCETFIDTETELFKIVDKCPFCEEWMETCVEKLPDYMTPAEMEKIFKYPLPGETLCFGKDLGQPAEKREWYPILYKYRKTGGENSELLVVAYPPVLPPKEWEPEKEAGGN